MTRSTHNPWLARFAAVTAVATLCLIAIGGVVTSKGVGMSVPDWPTTYGYNMFLFPISQWVGGIREEHSHRLFASWVGLLTVALAVWIWLKDSRSWLRWLGVGAVFAVVLQGVIGGARVVWKMDGLGVPHAGLAQVFFCLMVALAVFLSKWWQNFRARGPAEVSAARGLRPILIITTSAIFLQLMLGAAMRHQHSGLAVPDFPLAYGRIWPKTDAASVDLYNRVRHDHREFNDITAGQIHLHMTHRALAVGILGLVAACWIKARNGAAGQGMARLARVWMGMILLQAALGVVTVLKNKPADIATAHVVVGAASLALGVLMCMMLTKLARERALEKNPVFEPDLAGAQG